MIDDVSSPIPGRLRAEGFSVVIGRMQTGDARRVWSASATREGQYWNAFGEDLSVVLFDLERQTQEGETDWGESIADDMLEIARTFRRAKS